LKDYASRYLNVDLDIESASSIEDSVQNIENVELRQIVSILVIKTLQPPKYFCTGIFDISKYSHYSAGTPLFTHFTAPLRRYADIIAHRQLDAVLSGGKVLRTFYLYPIYLLFF
jgi:protein SSD1